jgi:S-adenosylmethionine hydrolase
VSPGPPAPAIYFLSDYGTADEFVGVVHAVLHRHAPGLAVIDLSHQIPPFDVSAGAAMLIRCAPHLGAGVVLAVVDPGVGTARRAVAVRVTGGSGGWAPSPGVPEPPPTEGVPPGGPTWLVGPDNGLLVPLASALGGSETAIVLGSGGQARREAGGAPFGRGPTFDGRDVFAPAAAHLALGGDPALLGTAIDPASLIGVTPGPPQARERAPDGDRAHARDRLVGTATGAEVVTSVGAVDRFGNVELTLLPDILDVPHQVGLPQGGTAEVRVDGGPAVMARRVVAFGELGAGELGLLIDSSGRLALVCNQASAATRLGLDGPGAEVSIRVRVGQSG